MYHHYRKDSVWLRQALLDAHQGRCAYCGTLLQPRFMQVDHIVPTNPEPLQDSDIIQYIEELKQDGFIQDSIENYLPSCSDCNNKKSNHLYSATNLRHFHEIAKRHAEEILARIETLRKKGDPEHFYEPLDASLWEELSFDYQRSIAHAIMGYRLTPADVAVCPRFPQVERIKRQLDIVDYATLQGEPGCGKSISVYQAAYDLYQEGWSVYRLRINRDIVSLHLSNNTTPTLYIIDDAQLLPEHLLQALTEQTRPNAKLVIAITAVSAVGHDTILLTSLDAVNQLYKYYMQRKEELIPIVHKADNRIGIAPLDIPIERRLGEAQEASTPWQFNYVLRGGWQGVREQYQAICNHHNCDLLAAAIAVFQIVHLDHSVNFELLCSQLRSVDSHLFWDQGDLTYLVNQKVVLSYDDVRIVHMESAKVIIAQFLEHATKEKQEVLCSAVENAFLGGHFSKLGLVWLCNGLSGYRIFPSVRDRFISEKMVTFALEQLSVLQAAQERRDVAYFLEKVFDMEYPHNGRYYFYTQRDIWIDWISHANSENAYAFSLLLNTLYNNDKKAYTRFVSKIDWTLLMGTMCHEKHPNLYAWAKLIDRLAIKKIGSLQQAVLENAVREIRTTISTDNILEFSYLLSYAGYHITSCVHETVSFLAPVYQAYFRQNMKEGMELFDFEFFLTICGISLLGGHRATSAEKRSAATIVAALPEAELASTISSSLPRNWQRIHEVMALISKYDRPKAKRIVLAVDLGQLSINAKNAWENNQDIDRLCIALYLGSPPTARRFIEMNQNRITTVPFVLIGIAPKCTATLFQKGIPFDLVGQHRWAINAWAFQALFKVNADVASTVLSENLSQIVKWLNQLSAYSLEDNGCISFLQIVQKYAPDIWNKIAIQVDLDKLAHCLDNCPVRHRNRKGMEKRLQQLIGMVEAESSRQG